MTPLVATRQLRFRYQASRRSDNRLRKDWTLKGLDLTIDRASTVGIVGESGSGKSTLVRILCGLLPIGSGSATYDGRSVSDWLDRAPRDFRRDNQLVFQNPARSFDPRIRILHSLAEPVKAIERRSPSEGELVSWITEVGLTAEVLPRYPHQLSGGQLQRIAVARALSVRPRVVYADEPTSALDVSVQAQVLNLLMDMRTRHGLTLVMVSHDLAVISRLSEWIVVLKDGEIVETGATADVLRSPKAGYTAKLIEAAQAVSLVTTAP